MASNITNTASLFIGPACFENLYPTGDYAFLPASGIFNSNGGSTPLYSYVNDWQTNFPDTTYITNNQLNIPYDTNSNNPFLSVRKVIYTAHAGGYYIIYGYDTGTTSLTPLVQLSDSTYKIIKARYDNINNLIYYFYSINFQGVQSALILAVYNIDTQITTNIYDSRLVGVTQLVPTDFVLHYDQRLIYIAHNNNAIYTCNFDGSNLTQLSGSNQQFQITITTPGSGSVTIPKGATNSSFLTIGGGGADWWPFGTYSYGASGGGGGGASTPLSNSALTTAVVINYTVGAGGAAPVSVVFNGKNGGDSSANANYNGFSFFANGLGGKAGYTSGGYPTGGRGGLYLSSGTGQVGGDGHPGFNQAGGQGAPLLLPATYGNGAADTAPLAGSNGVFYATYWLDSFAGIQYLQYKNGIIYFQKQDFSIGIIGNAKIDETTGQFGGVQTSNIDFGLVVSPTYGVFAEMFAAMNLNGTQNLSYTSDYHIVNSIFNDWRQRTHIRVDGGSQQFLYSTYYGTDPGTGFYTEGIRVESISGSFVYDILKVIYGGGTGPITLTDLDIGLPTIRFTERFNINSPSNTALNNGRLIASAQVILSGIPNPSNRTEMYLSSKVFQSGTNNIIWSPYVTTLGTTSIQSASGVYGTTGSGISTIGSSGTYIPSAYNNVNSWKTPVLELNMDYEWVGPSGANTQNLGYNPNSNGFSLYKAELDLTYCNFTPPTPFSGTSPLFIGQVCNYTLAPSGDAGITPSGYIDNSDKTYSIGSGNLWSYINDLTTINIPDNRYVRTYESGVRTFDNIYFADWNGNNCNINTFSIANKTTNTLFSFNTTVSGVASDIFYDFVDNMLTVQVGGINTFYDMNTNQLSYSKLSTGWPFLDHITNTYYYIGYNTITSNTYTYNFGTNTQIISVAQNVAKRKLYMIVVSYPYTGGGALWRLDFNGPTLSYLGNISSTYNFSGRTFDESNNCFFKGYVDSNFNYQVGKFSINEDTGTFSSTATNTILSSSDIVGPAGGGGGGIKLDTFNGDLYYVNASGGYQYLTKRNIYNSGITTQLACSGSFITCFEFGRDYYKQVSDYWLTKPGAAFGATPFYVTDCSITARAIENHSGTMMSARVLTGGSRLPIWCAIPPAQIPGIPNQNPIPIYSSWNVKSGEQIQTIGSNTTQLISRYNNKTDWNNSVLRLESSSIINSGEPCSFDIKAVQINISCSGSTPGILPTGITSIPLFTRGTGNKNRTTTLFIAGAASVGGIPLYIKSLGIASGVCTLYTKNSIPNNSGIPLFIKGGIITNQSTLYIKGLTSSIGTMPLLVQGTPKPAASLNRTLFTIGSANSGIPSKVPMFMASWPRSGVGPNGNMNMYMGGTGSYKKTSNMILYLRSNNYNGNILSTAPMIIKNEVSGIYNTPTMYMNGPPGALPAYPLNGNMNLFIARSSSSQANGISLFMSNNQLPISQNIKLYLNGQPSLTGNPPMFIKNIANINNNPNLYIGGF